MPAFRSACPIAPTCRNVWTRCSRRSTPSARVGRIPLGSMHGGRGLVEEAVWLGHVVVGLLPEEPEGLGLLALMLYAGARRDARRSAYGDYVPLSEQDPALWDAAAIDEAERLLQQASSLGRIGRFQLEAAVQSVHAARRTSGRTDWGAILELYDGLLALTHSPVVAINRAVAFGETSGPAAGLAALDELAGDQRIAAYQPYWAARADLLARLGRRASADAAYAQAILLEPDAAVRHFLEQRRARIRPNSF